MAIATPFGSDLLEEDSVFIFGGGQFGVHDAPGQSQFLKDQNGPPCGIQFPPFHAVGSRSLLGMMVVVPAFTK